MEPKYLSLAEDVLSIVYKAAPDIFDNVWCLLQENGEYSPMVEEIAATIKAAVEQQEV